MRRSLLILLLTLLLVLLYAVYSVSTLISLLFEDAHTDAIPSSDLPALHAADAGWNISHPQLIPKIIHQTYKDEHVPSRWLEGQQACKELHGDYEYIFWTDASALEFIQTEYPWFEKTFVSYSHPIQRVDALRYFILYHHGGIYIDLDDGCVASLDPLLIYPAWLRRTLPTGISNDVMGARPHHPFFLHVMNSLEATNRAWVLPYITIMASTGPLFLSVMWKQWLNRRPAEEDRIRVLMLGPEPMHSWTFFETAVGDSWHEWDSDLIFWMGDNWVLVTLAGFAFAAVLGGVGWWLYLRLASWSITKRRPLALDRFPNWRSWGRRRMWKDYELVETHDA